MAVSVLLLGMAKDGAQYQQPHFTVLEDGEDGVCLPSLPKNVLPLIRDIDIIIDSE